MERLIANYNVDIDQTFYGKFMKNKEKIRNLARADPNSYAAVVVTAVDCFAMGVIMLEEALESQSSTTSSCCSSRILKEFADSLRASEIFALWTLNLQRDVRTMAERAIKMEGRRKSDLDRNARICFGMLTAKDSVEAIVKTMQFMDESRKKYPAEVFFHRIYCYLFTFAKEWEAGIQAADEALKLFPNDANILNARASMLRMLVDKGSVDYVHWSRQKKQAEDVKQAYKDYVNIAPKDHRHFADNNYFVAYFAFKYAAPSAQIMDCDMQEISVYYQNGLNAELDVLPCFLPFASQAKDFLAKNINMQPSIDIYHDGDTCNIDMTTNGMPGRPKNARRIPTEHMTVINACEPKPRKIALIVAHRQRLQSMFSDPSVAIQKHHDADNDFVPSPSNSNIDSSLDFEELILYQLTMTKESRKFTSQVIHLTSVEDPVYESDGRFETIVADTTGDVIKLQFDLDARRTDNFVMRGLMKKFRFGTMWKLPNPDFHMENADENTMYIRATPECLISIDGGGDGPKCRMCYKALCPGRKCAKCKLALYCGKDCQTKDWKFTKHHLICSDAYANFYKSQ